MRERVQHVREAFRGGEIALHVADVEQNGHFGREQFVNPHHAGIVDGEALEIGVELQAGDAEVLHAGELALHVVVVGVERTEADDLRAEQGREIVVQIPHLVRAGGGGEEHGLVDVGFLEGFVQVGHGAFAAPGLVVVGFEGCDDLRRDAVGEHMTMHVEVFHRHLRWNGPDTKMASPTGFEPVLPG